MAKGYPDYRYLALPLAENDGGTGVDLWAGARVYNSAALTIATTTDTKLTFNSERYDHGDLHSTISNTGRLTAPKAGKYLISAHIAWTLNATGSRRVSIWLNNLVPIARLVTPGSANYQAHMGVSTLYHLAAGDYVEVSVMQESGGNLDVVVEGNSSPEFAMQWVGP